MSALIGMNAFTATVLALILGAAFGLSLSHQIQLQRYAQQKPPDRRGRIGERLTYAGLSFALLAVIALMHKHLLGIGYVAFIFVAAAGAIASLALRLKSRAKRRK